MRKLIKKYVLCLLSKLNITANLAAENLALRQQLLVLKRKNKRPLYTAVQKCTTRVELIEEVFSP